MFTHEQRQRDQKSFFSIEVVSLRQNGRQIVDNVTKARVVLYADSDFQIQLHFDSQA